MQLGGNKQTQGIKILILFGSVHVLLAVVGCVFFFIRLFNLIICLPFFYLTMLHFLICNFTPFYYFVSFFYYNSQINSNIKLLKIYDLIVSRGLN